METKRERKEVTGFKLILGYLGVFLVLVGFLTALPLLIITAYPSEYVAVPAFAIPASADVVAGFTFYFLFLFHKKPSKFRRHEESQLLTLIWLLAIVSGAMPFFIAGKELTMNFTKAFFESSSSYTGTGLTGFLDYIDVEGAFAPHVFTYHRSQMQFIGGVGLVLLVASILGANAGVKLYVSEGHSDKLLPNIAKSAKLIFGIYIMYSFFGTVALYFAGMPWFEAACTSMCALSGGGMSVRAKNIGSYRELAHIDGCFFPVNSLAIEIIVMVLVILGMISFVLHTFILRGKFKTFIRDAETKYIMIIGTAAILVSYIGTLVAVNSIEGFAMEDGDAGLLFRNVIFYVIGSFTTSGFAVTDGMSRYHFLTGPNSISMGKPLIFICTLMMIVGADAGSTGGGIKQFRVSIAFKELWYSIRYKFSPAHQIHPKTIYRYGEIRELDEETAKESFNYILLYICVLIISVTALCFNTDYDAEIAAFDVASAMGNVGLGLVDYTPIPTDFLHFMPFWILSFDMLFGRLEIMPLFYAVSNIREEIAYEIDKRKARKITAESLE